VSATSDVEVGTFIVMTLTNSETSVYHIAREHWDEIDGAMHNWIERRIDRVLALRSTNGHDCLVPASRINDVFMSTPEGRARGRELDAAMKAEAGFQE
jgi:hypothetical protein